MAKQKGLKPAQYAAGASHYCGPTSLSAITGNDTADVTRFVRRKWPWRKSVKGMHNEEAVEYLKHCGFRVELVYASMKAEGWRSVPRQTKPDTKPMNLRTWLDEYAARRETYLVNVTGHYIAVHNGLAVCTSKSGRMVPVAELTRHIGRQMVMAWRVS